MGNADHHAKVAEFFSPIVAVRVEHVKEEGESEGDKEKDAKKIHTRVLCSFQLTLSTNIQSVNSISKLDIFKTKK